MLGNILFQQKYETRRENEITSSLRISILQIEAKVYFEFYSINGLIKKRNNSQVYPIPGRIYITVMCCIKNRSLICNITQFLSMNSAVLCISTCCQRMKLKLIKTQVKINKNVPNLLIAPTNLHTQTSSFFLNKKEFVYQKYYVA